MRPVAGSTIFCSWCGITLPTVPTRTSMGSSTSVMLQTGEVSVMPQAMVISGQCISVTTRFITSTGHGAPAIMPVRRDDKSNWLNCGWSSSAMNMVGTPCNAVQRGQDHRCAVRHAGEVAQHHAEAVIERHRDAEPIAVCEAHPLANPEGVV